MTSAPFNYAPLLPPGLPAPAARFTGLAKYSFVGGNNDPDGVPVDELVAAVTAVLKREGKSLATYNLAHGPQGYGPLREFLLKKLNRALWKCLLEQHTFQFRLTQKLLVLSLRQHRRLLYLDSLKLLVERKRVKRN